MLQRFRQGRDFKIADKPATAKESKKGGKKAKVLQPADKENSHKWWLGQNGNTQGNNVKQ